MRTVAKYIKLFVCVMIVIAALVAPVTGFVPQKGSGGIIAKNQIDQSNFSPRWTDSVLDFSNIQNNEPQESIHKAIWDFSSQETSVVVDGTDTQNSFADILKNDSASGYDKLVEMARNGYADFGSQVVTSSAYRSQETAGASSQPVWNDPAGPGGRGDSGSNGYTDVPANPGDPGTKPVDPGPGGGGTTDPVDPPPVDPPPVDNPVVPAPPALLLALGGAMLVAKFKKMIK